MRFNTKLVGLLVCFSIIMSCQKDNLLDADNSNIQLKKVALFDSNGVPMEYIKILRDEMGITSEITYDEKEGMLYFDDTGLGENYLAYFLLNGMELDDEDLKSSGGKGYTIVQNHVADVSLASIVRCQFGQSASNFATYRMTIRYAFESDFPQIWRPLVREAFAIWEEASNEKFEWIEDSSYANAYLKINYFQFSPVENAIAKGAFPISTKQGFHVGDWIHFDSESFDPVTGTSIVGRTALEAANFVRNTAMHEIGHNLGMAHFHNANQTGVHHVPGTNTAPSSSPNGNTESVMSYFSDRERETLYPDDINTVQVLYPFTGNASTAPTCDCKDEYPDVNNDGLFTYLAMGDVNNSGTINTSDMLRVQQHILGISNDMSAYEIQKAGALNGSVNTLSTSDLLKLQRIILGIDSPQGTITQSQFVKLADGNGDGILTNADKTPPYIPTPSGTVFNLDYSIYSNYISELHESVGMMDGDRDTYTSTEYNSWISNF